MKSTKEFMDTGKHEIGVIGNGFVGGAIVQGFNTFKNVLVYDSNPMKSLHTLEEVLKCRYVFICLPTPMVSAEGGESNLSIIEEFFSSLSFNKDQVFIIKSTVPIGTTRRFRDQFNLPNIVHCPEFLTAKNSRIDFICASRNIVGGEKPYSQMVQKLFEERFPGTPVYMTTSDESEMIKYSSNCFFATKIIFFNEIKMLCDSMGMDWDKVLQGVISDGRIGQSHYDVPGHDGEYGFGGTCFPKDINAMIKTMEAEGLSPDLLKAVWEKNKVIRSDWDWKRSSSAVSSLEQE